MNKYKVCILAAGVGSRMEKFTKTFNKALIPVSGKPAICHIIDKFPKDVEIVITLGYKKETIVDFLEHNYPDRKLTFVEIDKYVGAGTGPGYSLLQCKNHLQCPFIFLSSDTLIKEEVPTPDENWFGLAEVMDTSRFCSAKTENGKVVKIDDKIKCDNKYAFIGLAGVKDYNIFWDALENNKNLISGEIQVSNGFTALIGSNFLGKIFTWFDTGTPDAYKYTLENYPHGKGYMGEETKNTNKMKTNIEKDIFSRTKCPLCLSEKISGGIYPHINLKFPILPVCVDTPKEEDDFAPFTICICENCGLIMLKEVVNPDILYKIFHSDGIGRVWEEHYSEFAKLIKKHLPFGKILEIGAGQGKLISKLLKIYDSGIEVIDPLYEGPIEGVKVHREILNSETDLNFKEEFDAVVSSHTLEHFLEFNDYFQSAWKVLKKGGLLFSSVPNQELGFLKGYGNQLNFEHPSVCTNAHWIYLHLNNGFIIKEISFFQDHSVQIVAEKTDKSQNFQINVKELSRKILDLYWTNIQARMDKVKQFAKPDKENWIFGASNFSQPLFVYGLNEDYFKGVLDNSPLKHNKRLYGTNLICRKPEEVVIPEKNNLRIFLNLGHYNQEIFEQLKSLNPSVEFIFL